MAVMKTLRVVPFVVSVDAGTYYGEAVISLVGIILASCRESAFEQGLFEDGMVSIGCLSQNIGRMFLLS
jgi:hypothetical protein